MPSLHRKKNKLAEGLSSVKSIVCVPASQQCTLICFSIDLENYGKINIIQNLPFEPVLGDNEMS